MALNIVTLTEQKMKDGSTKLQLDAPYSPSMPPQARALGGKWNAASKAWFFDLRDADRVRALCLDTYGVDPLAGPDEAPELVTVRLEVGAFDTRRPSLWLFGREIASQPSRDGRPLLGQGVVVISGGFNGGGSRANPALNARIGTILEVRDVPRPLVEDELRSWASKAEAARATLATDEAAVAALQARIDAGPTDLDLAAQVERPASQGGGYLTPEEAGEHAMSTARVRLADAQGKVERQRAWVADCERAIRILEDAPAPAAVPSGLAQIQALFQALGPAQRRAAVTAMIGSLDGSERRELLKELGVVAAAGGL